MTTKLIVCRTLGTTTCSNVKMLTDIDQLGIIVTVRIGWYTSTRFRVHTIKENLLLQLYNILHVSCISMQSLHVMVVYLRIKQVYLSNNNNNNSKVLTVHKFLWLHYKLV